MLATECVCVREREKERWHTLKAEVRTVYSALVTGMYMFSSIFKTLFWTPAQEREP